MPFPSSYQMFISIVLSASSLFAGGMGEWSRAGWNAFHVGLWTQIKPGSSTRVCSFTVNENEIYKRPWEGPKLWKKYLMVRRTAKGPKILLKIRVWNWTEQVGWGEQGPECSEGGGSVYWQKRRHVGVTFSKYQVHNIRLCSCLNVRDQVRPHVSKHCVEPWVFLE